jgi:hypothetical protein
MMTVTVVPISAVNGVCPNQTGHAAMLLSPEVLLALCSQTWSEPWLNYECLFSI